MTAALRPHRTLIDEPFASVVTPLPLAAPSWGHRNDALAADLALPALDDSWLPLLAGNATAEGIAPVACRYAGHQFGSWVPQLGDGRAMLIGTVRGADGVSYELQLKGAGPTPYSRGGDGRAVLRSSIREYLASEAMAALGVPTTRALALVHSPQPVYREEIETAAVVTRVAPSFLRFGSFEIWAHRDRPEELRTLADHVIAEHLPELAGRDDRHQRLYATVVERTATLVADWMAVGFSHGVMNTDNMSILGLTLDYGPYGFLDAYDPAHICNHSDHGGRYAFGQQPAVAFWNLRCLGGALLPLMAREAAQEALGLFRAAYIDRYAERMRHRLGLQTTEEDDATLVNDLLDQMSAERLDYHLTLRSLSRLTIDGAVGPVRDGFVDRERFDAWAARYRARLRREGSIDDDRRARMDAVNPLFVLRNWVAEEVIRAAADRGDFSVLDTVLERLRRPFDASPPHAEWSQPPPDWAAELSVSCSS